MEPPGNISPWPKTYLDKERLLTANGVAVPPYPKPPPTGKDAGTVEEANFMATFDAWELEADRLYELFLNSHPDQR